MRGNGYSSSIDMPETTKTKPTRNCPQAFSLHMYKLARYLWVFGLLIASFLSSHVAQAQPKNVIDQTPTAQDKPQIEGTHYLIPGFSRYLIENNYVINQDLHIAERVANHHDTLRLRIALADANGHLLQMATPPALVGLRDQIVAVSEQLDQARAAANDPNWGGLLSSIRHVRLPSTYESARTVLEKTALNAQKLAVSGHLHSSQALITELISEIEITAHVYSIDQLRNDIQKAIMASSHANPHWIKTIQAISKATSKTRWLLQPSGRHLIQGYDAAVAASVEWPEANLSRESLRLAYRYLNQSHKAKDLAQNFLDASRDPALSLPAITHLQNALALYIQESRNSALPTE